VHHCCTCGRQPLAIHPSAAPLVPGSQEDGWLDIFVPRLQLRARTCMLESRSATVRQQQQRGSLVRLPLTGREVAAAHDISTTWPQAPPGVTAHDALAGGGEQERPTSLRWDTLDSFAAQALRERYRYQADPVAGQAQIVDLKPGRASGSAGGAEAVPPPVTQGVETDGVVVWQASLWGRIWVQLSADAADSLHGPRLSVRVVAGTHPVVMAMAGCTGAELAVNAHAQPTSTAPGMQEDTRSSKADLGRIDCETDVSPGRTAAHQHITVNQRSSSQAAPQVPRDRSEADVGSHLDMRRGADGALSDSDVSAIISAAQQIVLRSTCEEPVIPQCPGHSVVADARGWPLRNRQAVRHLTAQMAKYEARLAAGVMPLSSTLVRL
jgi:hypothetical protein